ncbi:hypothetical protein GGTG_02384 [Gaeumannomyces tritici R3-111a-1]|uniref:Uncharacterized protein n=1 Tax=Gaeumannomyces tritici (strain R3-111a-1) TaxID=644352 RepID=J3NM80_GAET3|nr:hypothetical protein GGTG_02384 [Gaeumannomyces tritici R3-111a-1]EJT82411.1 hypothetical protein GGTG_02384 [Gaeumannomyces tritici R3-111a-1]
MNEEIIQVAFTLFGVCVLVVLGIASLLVVLPLGAGRAVNEPMAHTQPGEAPARGNLLTRASITFAGSFVWEPEADANQGVSPLLASLAPMRIPVKWILLMLADGIDAETLEQLKRLPGGQTILSLQDEAMSDPAKFAQLEKIWIDHFRRVKKEVDGYCELMGYEVAHVTFSVAHWCHTEGMQRVYHDLLRRVFTDLPESAFHYTGEANSAARCLIEEDLKLPNSKLSKIAGDRRTFLFFDPGGSSLGSSLILLHRDGNQMRNENEPAAMLEIRESGCFGGSEVWEWAIVEKITENMFPRPTNDQLTKFMQNFRAQKGRIANPYDDNIDFSDVNGAAYSVSDSESGECYNLAFEKITTLIQAEIATTITALGGPEKFIVIFSGGGCLGVHIINLLVECAKATGVDALIHGTKGLGKSNPNRIGMVARGNAYAMKHAISLGQFLGRGATFGIQTGDGAGKKCELIMPLAGLGAAEGANMRFDVERSQLDKADEATMPMWLVCDAFFGDVPDQGRQMAYTTCYDVCRLRGVSRAGAYVYKIRIERAEQEGMDAIEKASIVITCRFTPAGRRPRKNPHVDLEPEVIPIHYHIGSGCALVDVRKLEAEAAAAGQADVQMADVE